MDTWKIREFDEMSEGEVALKIFELRTELHDAQNLRASASIKLSEISKMKEKAKEEYREAVQTEDYISKEIACVEKYLQNRIEKSVDLD